MTKRSAANTPTTPLRLSEMDIQLIRTAAMYKYISVTDLAYALDSPSSLTYVRHRASRLAGGADHIPHQYLYRFSRPHTEAGRPEKIFIVGTKGWDLLAELHGGDSVDGHYRPNRVKKLSYSFVLHALLLTRFVVSAYYWSRQQADYTPEDTILSYELARTPARTAMTVQGETVSVIPDAYVCFQRVMDGRRFHLIFEADCATESASYFRHHIRNRLAYLQSPQYHDLAGTNAGRICYLTIGQHPKYKHTRLAAMQRYTQEVLAAAKMQAWASVFLFAAVDYNHLYQTPLFDKALWYLPNSQTPQHLLTPQPDTRGKDT